MIKKWLYYFYVLSIIVLFIYLGMIFIYSKKNREYIANVSSNYLENQLIELKYKQIKTVKRVLENEYNILLNNYKFVQIQNTKKEIESIKKLLEIISLIKKKEFYIYINNYFSKTKLDFHLEILNDKKIVIASSDFFDVGQKKSLKCDPFENYGTCEIKNDFYYYVTYLPNMKVYIVARKKFTNPSKDYFKPILLTLKSFPEIIYDVDKLDNKHFYVFERFKPLNLFFGIGVSYKRLENFPKKFIKQSFNFLFYHYLKLTFFMILITIIYLIISTLIFLKLKHIGLEIEEDAFYDKLTKLYNRQGLDEFYDENKTLLILDLDNFKYINDTFGHEKGDEILIKFATLLKKYFKGDIISRWGGDEFVVLTDKPKEEIKRIISNLNKEIEKIQKTFDAKLTQLLSVSCGGTFSKGIKEKRFHEADLALYKVKKTTKRGCRFYDELDYVKIEDI